MNWFTRLFSKNTPSPDVEKLQKLGKQIQPEKKPTPELAQPAKVLKQNQTPEKLKKFVPLRELDEPSLAALPHASLFYKNGDVIFALGQQCDCVYYLLEGSVRMCPDGDSSYEISAGALSSLPLNSGNRCGASATARGEVWILQFFVDLNRLWSNQAQENHGNIEFVDIHFPDEISGNRFFHSFAQAYRDEKLVLPSLPDIAMKLREAMRKDMGIDEVVKIIHTDPPIVAKLIQVANSPLYDTGMPVSNCHEAIRRIGLDATRNLVMSVSLKQLFNCKDRNLIKNMQALWKNSLYVSSLSFVLAQECGGVKPEDAMLAGLITDIGAIPLLNFAEQFPEEYRNFEELESSLPFLRAPVGSLVLHTLGFSEQLTQIPRQAENWFYDSGPEMTLEDIIILAKLHSYFGSGKARGLPYINSIPAYDKLEHGTLNPDFSLKILRQAQNRVNAAMYLLS